MRRLPGAIQALDRRLRSLDRDRKRRLTRGAALLGLPFVLYYYTWWLDGGRLFRPALAPLFGLAVVYGVVQVLSAWFIYTRIAAPEARRAAPGLAVDVFVPVYDEDAALVEDSLRAALAVSYPHRTLLLDDSGRDELRALAERLGALYLRRSDRSGNKAGNVNHALGHSHAEFVAIFDVDHLPLPGFLDEVLGQFEESRVGWVQAFVAHRNQAATFVSRAASGQSDDVFGPTSMGMHGCGAAQVWGAHCTFRRAALDAIGGYQVGLAEDLHTSLALHAAGWRSVYVPRVVTGGLVTADLHAYAVQQLKWSRGVFEVLLARSLEYLPRLSPPQVASYLTRMTYYLMGPVVLAHLLLLVWALSTGVDLSSYWKHLLPAVLAIVATRKVMGAMWECDPQRGWQLTGTALALATWPVYALSLVMAMLRIPLRHVPTPKAPSPGRRALGWVMPQATLVTALLGALLVDAARGLPAGPWTAVVAVLAALVHLPVFVGAWEARRAGSAGVPSQPAVPLPSIAEARSIS